MNFYFADTHNSGAWSQEHSLHFSIVSNKIYDNLGAVASKVMEAIWKKNELIEKRLPRLTTGLLEDGFRIFFIVSNYICIKFGTHKSNAMKSLTTAKLNKWFGTTSSIKTLQVALS